jgi:prepilin-type N-terminal cleavage/methylation domain-containing protein
MVNSVLDRRGFSLVEVIIAIAILGFSLLAIIPLLSTSLSVNTETSVISKIQMLGAELISELQTWPEDDGDQANGDDIINSGCLDLATGAMCTADTQTYKGITITRSYRIDRLMTGTPNTNYLLTVMVSFDYRGKTIERVFTAPWIRQ